jgi:hypothetical protein
MRRKGKTMTCMVMSREIRGLKVVGLDMGQAISILMARIVSTSLSGRENLKEGVEERAFSIPHSPFKNLVGAEILLRLTLVALALWETFCQKKLDLERPDKRNYVLTKESHPENADPNKPVNKKNDSIDRNLTTNNRTTGANSKIALFLKTIVLCFISENKRDTEYLCYRL